MHSENPEQFRAALSGLLASDTFVRSPALGRLLSYLIERTLAGESASLKEAVIGHELYGRPAGYDPKLDSVVRVSANRLRLRLEDFYRANPGELLRICLPRGSYIPLLEVHPEPAASATSDPPLSTGLPSGTFTPAAILVPQNETPFWWKRLHGSVTAQAALLAFTLGAVFLGSMLFRTARYPVDASTETDWNVRPFARLGGSQQFGAFSPDGTQLAFTSTSTNDAEKAIYIQAVASEEARRIAVGVRPSWSPDGRSLAFIRPADSGRRSVILYNLASKTETTLAQLTGVGPWLCQIPRLSWSSDGQTLYSTSSSGSNPTCGIVAIDVASHQVRPLFPPASLVGDLDPVVSPDGSAIAFMREVAMGACDLFLVSTHGGEARRLTHDGANIIGFDWSADGKALIVASEREGGTRRLWRMPVDGGPIQALTDGASAATFPRVSSQGKLISFTQFHVTAPIWKVSGGKTVEILDNQSLNSTPTISPDGSKLLYGSDREGKWGLWLSNADGSDSRPLLRDHTYVVGGGRWSPDGREIVMECRREMQPHICISDANGDGVHPVTRGDEGQVMPSWSRDGRAIYFATGPRGTFETYRMDLASGATVHVANSKGSRALESWDGKWLYVTQRAPGWGILALPVGSLEHATDSKPVAIHTLDADPGEGWDVTREGIVYAAGDEAAHRLDVFDMQTRTSRTLLTLGKFSAGSEISVGVLPDGHGVVFTASHTHSELSMMSPRR